MPGGIQHPTIAKAVQSFLSSLRTWWQQRNELVGVDAHEIERIGAELGLTVADLRDLAARGPDAADLLYRRMKALGISRGDVERTALGLMRDLERTCSCCEHKGECAEDLETRPAANGWKDYCPNAISLHGVAGPVSGLIANHHQEADNVLQDHSCSPERRAPGGGRA